MDGARTLLSAEHPQQLRERGIHCRRHGQRADPRDDRPALTPPELRGRVGAVEHVFIGASNELGAFESGVAAALLGAVPAVIIGGAVSIVVAVVWAWRFPQLRTIDRFDEIQPIAPE